jgi:hypothetical protein
MAFSVRNLSVLAYANGFTLWHYRGFGQTLAATAEPGFFADAADMMAEGDLLMISAADGGRIVAITRAGESAQITTVGLN